MIIHDRIMNSLLVQWGVTQIISEVEVCAKIAEHLIAVEERIAGAWNGRNTHPNKLLVPLRRGDMQRSLPLHVRPVQNIGVPIIVQARHTQGSTEKLLLALARAIWTGDRRFGIGE